MKSIKTADISPAASAVLERSRGVLFSQWEELLRLSYAVAKMSGPDDIHDLRVATRRFRAALELFDPMAPNGSKTELKKSVRKLTRVLGGLRNIDEALTFFQSRIPADVFTGYKLFQALCVLRNAEFKQIRKVLTAFDRGTTDRMVREMVAGLHEVCTAHQDGFALTAYFSERSIRLFLPIQPLLAVSSAPEHRESRHALRIAIKKWRYLLEIVAAILTCDYSSQLELLKQYQSILGRMNDIVEFEILIKNLKLPRSERDSTKVLLQKENAKLLLEFIELLQRKPISYTFLINEAL